MSSAANKAPITDAVKHSATLDLDELDELDGLLRQAAGVADALYMLDAELNMGEAISLQRNTLPELIDTQMKALARAQELVRGGAS